MDLNQITPQIITCNEESNITQTLNKLRWASRILIIDSGSTDQTVEIAKSCASVEVVYRPFDTFAGQCNFGLSQIRTEWVLSLDADYRLSDELIEEIRQLNCTGAAGFRAGFVYSIFGKPLRGTLYPARCVLYRRDCATYRNYGHSHKVEINGEVRELRGSIFHDDRKPLARWFRMQVSYAEQEADYLLHTPAHELSRADMIRRMGWPAPILVFAYVLLIKGAILDGWAGWYYALQRLLAEVIIALELLDRRLRSALSHSN